MPRLPDHLPETPPRASRRALLIGSALGLYGIKNDVKTMGEALQLHGFSTKTLLGNSDSENPATRQGILNALNEFIADTQPGDVVVWYYSGHGNITEREVQGPESKDRWCLQFIVPMDFLKTKSDDFRGITDYEISEFLARLSEKTENITLILDCCHSARLARAGATMKSLVDAEYPQVFQHIKNMMQQMTTNDFRPMGNPSVVRLVAAQTTESGYEIGYMEEGTKVTRLVLTEALEEALKFTASNQAAVSWNQIMLRVNDRIAVVCPQQHPQIEGPSRRLCFRTEKEDRELGFPVSKVAGKSFMLKGGSIHGIAVNDKFAVMPYEIPTVLPDRQIAEVSVTSVSTLEARLSVPSWMNSFTALPERGAHAILTKKALRQFAVQVQGDDEFFRQVSNELQESRFVYAVAENEPSLIAFVNKEESSITLTAANGHAVRKWAGAETEPAPVDDIQNVLECLAKSQHVMRLRGNPATQWPNNAVSIEMGLVVDGEKYPFTAPGHSVKEEQEVYFEIINNGSRRVYVSILDVCLDAVTLVTNSSTTGIEISPGRTERIGSSIIEELTGLAVSWNDDVLRDGPVIATAVVVMTDRLTDLQNLETSRDSTGERMERKGDVTELMELVDQIVYGDERRMGKVMGRQVKESGLFGIWSYQYELVPEKI